MKILFTTHHFFEYTGTETYSYTLIQELLNKGHKITLYSRYLDKDKYVFDNNLNISFVNNLELVKNETFDIIHCQHNLNLIEVRYFFPNTPLIFFYHGVYPFLEQPINYELNIDYHVAVSQEIKEHLLKNHIPENKIKICPNMFDIQKFYPLKERNSKPIKAIILSNYKRIYAEEKILEACADLGITVDISREKYPNLPYNSVNELINEYDLVFTVGRGIAETILAERIAFIINDKIMSGIVTSDNFEEVLKNNFSGRRFKIKITKNKIINELNKVDSVDTKDLRKKIVDQMSGKVVTSKIEKIYREAIKKHKTKRIDKINNEFIYSAIDTTYQYDKIFFKNKTEELNKIKSSKTYKYWQAYNKIKKIILNKK